MAEMIFYHVRDATWREVEELLNEVAARGAGSGVHWRYPEENGPVTVYRYDSVIDEEEEHRRQQLMKLMGRRPSCTVCGELFRSRGLQAVEASRDLVNVLGQRFDGVADDSEVYIPSTELGSDASRRRLFAWMDGA